MQPVCVCVYCRCRHQAYEEVYGKQHNKTAACLFSLASMYRSSKRYEDAQDLYRSVLRVYEVRPASFGPP